MLSNDDLHAYRVDWDGPIPEDMSIDEDGINTTAIVEPPKRPLGEDHWRVLTEDYRRTLEEVFQHGNEDWMLSDYNYGVDFYREIRLWVTNRLNVNI